MSLKFTFIAACFAVAVVSYFWCRSKTDWAWLVGGLGFTLLADYFLILQGNHLFGVAAFCFVHVCYISRIRAGRGAVSDDMHTRPGYNSKPDTKVVLVVSAFFAVAWLAAFIAGSVIVLSVVYASLFALNLYVNATSRHPRRSLILAGLVLFALCDISVMLANLPAYIGAPLWLEGFFPIIWVFYLPSQGLLAISAGRSFREARSVPSL